MLHLSPNYRTNFTITLDGRHGSDLPFLATMKALCGEKLGSMIDLCSLNGRLTRKLPFLKKTYVDIIERDLEEEQKNFICADVLGDHPVLQMHYDVAICSDGIEHLTKEQGHSLLTKMKKMADRQVLFTPLNPWMVEPDNHHPESHKCVWVPDDLPDWGHVVLPVYHPTLNIGAFFFWNCANLAEDFKRVESEVRKIHWPD